MKNDLLHIFYEYLEGIGQLADDSLGPEHKIELNITKSHKDFFVKQIYEHGRINSRVIVLAIVLLIFILLIGLSLVIVFIKQPFFILSIFILTIVSVILILFQLKKFWLEKNLITMTIALIADLPPREATVYVHKVYMQLLQPKAHQVVGDFIEKTIRHPDIERSKEYCDKTNYVRKLIVKDRIDLAIDILKKVVDSHQFSDRVQITFTALKSRYINPENNRFELVTLKGEVLDLCARIDDEIEGYFERV